MKVGLEEVQGLGRVRTISPSALADLYHLPFLFPRPHPARPPPGPAGPEALICHPREAGITVCKCMHFQKLLN